MGQPSFTVYVDNVGTPHTFIEPHAKNPSWVTWLAVPATRRSHRHWGSPRRLCGTSWRRFTHASACTSAPN